MAVNDADQSHKPHRTAQAGPKKKNKSKKKHDGDDDGQIMQNPKAFAYSSSKKNKRLQSRTAEKEQRRLHVPIIDRSYGEPPPFVIVVQGPPQVCIVLFFSRSFSFVI
jgi:ribosome biogenesis protein BMS1